MEFDEGGLAFGIEEKPRAPRLDTGTYDSLLAASQFVQTLELRQGLRVVCIEEIAYAKGFIDETQLLRLADKYTNSAYAAYLRQCLAHYGAARSPMIVPDS